MTRRRTFAVGIAAVLCGTRVVAQDAKKPPALEVSADFGAVSVSGNTSVTTFNAGERLIRRIERWELKQDFGAVYGKTDDKETSNLWRASLRSDYGLTKVFALYALTAFDRNKFAGIKSRLSEGVGGVARLLATDVDQLNLEAGFALTQQKNIDDTDDNFKSLRGATSWKHSFSKAAYFFQSVEVLPNLDESKDLRVNTETAVVAPFSAHIGIKLSYVVRFDNLPSLNAAKTAPLRKSDRILSAGMQISY
jgi:putative salt-induced outer membrane protein YdiY